MRTMRVRPKSISLLLQLRPGAIVGLRCERVSGCFPIVVAHLMLAPRYTSHFGQNLYSCECGSGFEDSPANSLSSACPYLDATTPPGSNSEP